MFNRIQRYFIGDFLDKTHDPIERAGIRMIFYLLLMAVTLVWLIIPSLIHHGEYIQAGRSIFVNGIFIGMLFFIRRFHSVSIITHILILISFSNMVVNIFFIFNKMNELEVINAGINILVAFYILKKGWGIFYALLHVALLYVFTFFKEFGIIPPEPFAKPPLSEYIISMSILSIFTIFIIHHFVSAFELATGNLKSSLKDQMALTHQYQELSEQLKTSEGNLTSLIENYRDSIFSFDNNFRLITFNSPFAKVVKKFKTESPRRGMDVRTIVPLENGKEELYFDAFEKALVGKSVKFEDAVEMEIGNPRIYEVSVNPIWLDKGNQNGVSVFAKDITDRETARLELIKAKEMAEEMNRIKTNFLANMSHEIRTPINGILGISQIIAMETRNEEIKEYTEIQRQSGKRLLETINSILNLSRIEAGGVDEISLTKINLVDLLEGLRGSVSIPRDFPTIQLPGGSFQIQLDTDNPVFVIGSSLSDFGLLITVIEKIAGEWQYAVAF